MVISPVTEVSTSENRTDSWRTQTPHIDYSKCIRCMICWKFCPDNAIRVSSPSVFSSPNERIAAMQAPEIDFDHCKGCGICAYECPADSIQMSVVGGLGK